MTDAFLGASFRDSAVRSACQILPRKERSRYFAEWAGEYDAILGERGWLAALGFVIRLLSGAPRTAFVLRTNNRPVFFDVWLVSVTMSIPVLFFVSHGVVSRQPLLAASYLSLLLGLMIVASSVWSAEAGFLGGKVSAGGLLIVIVASIAITAMNWFTDTQNPALDGPFRILPGSLSAQFGVLLVMVSPWLGRHRVRVARVGLMFTMLGLLMWSVLAVANTVLVESWSERAFHIVTVPSMLAVASGCWIVRREGHEHIAPRQQQEAPAIESIFS